MAFEQNQPVPQSVSAMDLASQYEPALHGTAVEGLGQNDPNGQSISSIDPTSQ